jgi:hypothetical protein
VLQCVGRGHSCKGDCPQGLRCTSLLDLCVCVP